MLGCDLELGVFGKRGRVRSKQPLPSMPSSKADITLLLKALQVFLPSRSSCTWVSGDPARNKAADLLVQLQQVWTRPTAENLRPLSPESTVYYLRPQFDVSNCHKAIKAKHPLP